MVKTMIPGGIPQKENPEVTTKFLEGFPERFSPKDPKAHTFFTAHKRICFLVCTPAKDFPEGSLEPLPGRFSGKKNP